MPHTMLHYWRKYTSKPLLYKKHSFDIALLYCNGYHIVMDVCSLPIFYFTFYRTIVFITIILYTGV